MVDDSQKPSPTEEIPPPPKTARASRNTSVAAPAPPPEHAVERKTVSRWQLAEMVAGGKLQPSDKPADQLDPGFAGVLDGVEIYLEA